MRILILLKTQSLDDFFLLTLNTPQKLKKNLTQEVNIKKEMSDLNSHKSESNIELPPAIKQVVVNPTSTIGSIMLERNAFLCHH